MKPLRAEIQIIKARCLDTLQSNEPRIANGGMTSREKVLWCWLCCFCCWWWWRCASGGAAAAGGIGWEEVGVVMTTLRAATLAVQEGQRKVERQEQRMFMVVARLLS